MIFSVCLNEMAETMEAVTPASGVLEFQIEGVHRGGFI